MMIDLIKSWFQNADNTEVDIVHLNMACAALLIEVATADGVDDPREKETIIATIETVLGIEPSDIEQLLEETKAHRDDSVSLYPYTSLINERCGSEQKYQIILSMWRVAFADGDIDKYESHIIRKVASLIYVPHDAFIQAKIEGRARAEHSGKS